MQGVLLSISGPSGVGKTTICQHLVARLNAFLSVSATTRPRRDNEVDGRDYYFLSKQEFERRLEKGEFLEYAQVYGGNYYGTPAGPVLEALAAGRVVILEIEIAGTLQVFKRFPDLLGIYILAPTAQDLRDRLIGRQKDSAEAIRERLSKADGEIRYAQDCGAYRHFLINDDLEETVDSITRIVRENQRA
jgi:guanylate kinase